MLNAVLVLPIINGFLPGAAALITAFFRKVIAHDSLECCHKHVSGVLEETVWAHC